MIECQKKINIDDCVVLYIGAAPFISYNVIKKLYPKTKWISYDTNRFIFDKSDKNVKIENKFFTNEEINKIKNTFKNYDRKYLLYINDMRVNPDEKSVLKDMIQQQEWILRLNPFASSIKFRLPYNTEDRVDFNYKYHLKTNIKKCVNDIIYLDGTIYLQTYAPKRSTETRLISFRPYKLTKYDIIEYEEKLNYLNEKIRNKTFYI